MVDVAVRVDRGVERARRPSADEIVDGVGEEMAPDVDEDEPRRRVEGGHVGEARDERNAGGDLLELLQRRDQRVSLGSRQRACPEPLGDVHHAAHHHVPGSNIRSCRVHRRFRNSRCSGCVKT